MKPICDSSVNLRAGHASVLGALGGIDAGFLATAISFLSSSRFLSDPEISVFAGIGLFGTFVATVLGGRLADAIGRKRMVVLGVGLFAAGSWMVLFAPFAALLLAGRFITGLGLGLIYLALPIYLAETAAGETRGRTVARFQLWLVCGSLVGALVAAAMPGFRACFLVPGCLAAVAFVFAIRLPTCAATVARGADGAGRLPLLRTFAPVVLIGLFVPLSGIGPVQDFSVTLFKRFGWGVFGANGIDVLMKAISLGVTVFAAGVVDRFGRRSLMLYGTAAMAVSLTGAAAAIHFDCPSAAAACCALFVAAFSAGPGICVWILLSELLPRRVRARGISAALLVDYAAASLLMSGFWPLVGRIGHPAVFGCLAVVCAAFYLFVLFCLGETAGREL